MAEQTIVQAAVDVMSADLAIAQIRRAITAGVDWVELGRPLLDGIGLEGLSAITPTIQAEWLLDAMIIAAPDRYMSAAAKMGIQRITVSALAPQATVLDAIQSARRHGMGIVVDLFNTPDPVALGAMYADAGADSVMVHIGIDQKKANPQLEATELIRALAERTTVPISSACYSPDEARRAVVAGARIVVLGEFVQEMSDELLSVFVADLHRGASSKPDPTGSVPQKEKS